MGIWRVAGAFTVAEQQSELKISEANAGATTCEMHFSQPMNIGGCYVLVFFFYQFGQTISLILFIDFSSIFFVCSSSKTC